VFGILTLGGRETRFAALLSSPRTSLHIWEGRPCFLSTAHTAEDEVFIERAFKLAVAEMQRGGFLAGTSDPEFVEVLPGNPGKVSADDNENVVRPVMALDADQPCSVSPEPADGKPEGNRFPLTDAQVEMWVASQMAAEAAGPHHASNVIHLHGDLDLPALRRALAEVIQRHEALRCTFSPDGAAILVTPSLAFDLPVHDLSLLATAERERRKQAVINQEGQRIFDLNQGLCSLSN